MSDSYLDDTYTYSISLRRFKSPFQFRKSHSKSEKLDKINRSILKHKSEIERLNKLKDMTYNKRMIQGFNSGSTLGTAVGLGVGLTGGMTGSAAGAGLGYGVGGGIGAIAATATKATVNMELKSHKSKLHRLKLLKSRLK